MRLFHRIILISFLIYIGYTQSLIIGYEKMNDGLQRTIDTLLYTCTKSNVSDKETEPYK